MQTRTELRLSLTAHETAALAALTAGVSGVVESEVSEEDAMIAAIDLALTRLIEDFEVPDPEVRARVSSARDELRRNWVRGNSGL